jgi:hypothetical protein
MDEVIMMKVLKRVLKWIGWVVLFMIAGLVVCLAVDNVSHRIEKISFEETNIEQLTNNGFIDLFRDTQTDVVYVRALNGTLTVMVNQNGSPKLWSDYNN